MPAQSMPRYKQARRELSRQTSQTSGGLRLASSAKREPISTACEECRSRKCKVGNTLFEWFSNPTRGALENALGRRTIATGQEKCMLNQRKCTGNRPKCEACQMHNRECHHAREPDERPLAALRRKFEALQSQNAGEREHLSLLCFLPAGQATEVLVLLRCTEDVSILLRMTRSLLVAVSTGAQVVRSNQQTSETDAVRENITHEWNVHNVSTSSNPFVTKQDRNGYLLIDPCVSLILLFLLSQWRCGIRAQSCSTY